MTNVDDREWMKRAACSRVRVDMHPHDIQGVHLAQEVCYGCPVMIACGTYALDHHEIYGVWGAMSQRDRVQKWKARRRAALVPA